MSPEVTGRSLWIRVSLRSLWSVKSGDSPFSRKVFVLGCKGQSQVPGHDLSPQQLSEQKVPSAFS